MLPSVLQPRCQMIKGVSSGDVVDEQGPGGASVVRSRDRPEEQRVELL